MSHSEQFFQAVLDHPEDNMLRLVYADWLEEQGDPLGELIRVQVEMDQTPHAELYWRTLKNRETELLNEYLSDWLGPTARRVWKGFAQAQYQPFFAERGSCRLHRGFRETARIRGRTFFRHAAEIFQAVPLRELHIFLDGSVDEIHRELADLGDCAGLSKIRNLILEYTSYLPQPETASQNGLFDLLNASNIGELRALQIHYGFEMQHLAKPLIRSRQLSNLKTLALHSPPAENGRRRYRHQHRPQTLALAKNLPALRELLITNHELTDSMLHPVLEAPWFEQLTLLDLTGSSLSDVSFLRLAASPVCRNLQTIRLSRRADQPDSSTLQVPGCRALANADFSRLTELALQHQNIGSGKLRKLLLSAKLENLTTLDLSGNPLKATGAAVLAQCPLGNLRVLKLESCQLTDAGLSKLAHSPHLKRLEQLFVGGNAFTGTGLELFLHSPLLEHLRTLSIVGCEDWGDESFSRFARAGALQNLTELDLTGQRMNSVRVKKLVGSPHLANLAHLSWFQSPIAKRKPELEALLHERWPGRVRI